MHSRDRILIVTMLAGTFTAVLPGCRGGTATTDDPPARPATMSLPREQRDRIRTEIIQPATFSRTIEVTGMVAFDSDRATLVIAPISGPVSRLLVTVGDKVKAAQPLALVTSPDFAAAVGAYRKADATASNAVRIADLDEQLFANDAIAHRELEQAQTDAATAQADRDAALQQLRALGVSEATLSDIRKNTPVTMPTGAIRAPLAGTVVERLITPGQLVQAGATPCFTVADLSVVWVMAEVFESDLPFVALGDPAEVTAGASNGPLRGKVTYISALVDPATRAIAVRVATPNAGDLLKKDMYVRVAIQSRRLLTGLLVPVSAILRDDENLPFVYIENADGSFSRRSVTVRYRVGDREQITAGLSAGERVVVEGALFMQFAQSQ
jgi:cobalt-zinc-cadmium efflux system membrane fusion protein